MLPLFTFLNYKIVSVNSLSGQLWGVVCGGGVGGGDGGEGGGGGVFKPTRR